MLYIDLETRSATDLKMFGVYKYVEDPFFKIQLMSYAYDDGEVQILDFETNALLVIPEQVNDANMVLLARDISKQIESELEYPGQIKVNVIRESRVVDYAK